LTAVPARPVDVRFGARGYADKVVRVGMEESVEVVLERVAMLEVRLLDRREYKTLVLTAERSAFYWDQAAWNEPCERDEPGAFGCRLLRRPSTEEDQRFVYEITPDDNPFPLVGLTPYLPVTIEIRGFDGAPRASRTLTMKPAEHAVLELGVADPSGADGGHSTARDAPLRVARWTSLIVAQLVGLALALAPAAQEPGAELRIVHGAAPKIGWASEVYTVRSESPRRGAAVCSSRSRPRSSARSARCPCCSCSTASTTSPRC
jgi:hypothetical protein